MAGNLKNAIYGQQQSPDQIYSNVYNAVNQAQQSGNQNDINNARNLVASIKGTQVDQMTNGVNTFSSVLDGLQQKLSQPQQPIAPQVKDDSAQIGQMYDQSLASAQSALRAAIQQSMGNYQQTIANAPGQFQPLKNQASAAGANNMQNLREMLANNGQQGGVNRTEETQVNSATENNINSLNQQQQQVIDTANKAINDLKAQGDIKGAELVAQNASDRIKALIDEANRVDSTSYLRSQDAFNNGINLAGITGMYNGQQTMQGALNQANITGQNLQNQNQALINQYLPTQLQGQITGQSLQNDYQELVNVGYPQEQAQKLALLASQIAGQNLNNTNQSIQNQYLPQQLQASIVKTNSSGSSGSSGGNGGITSTQAKNSLFAEAQNYIDNADNVSYRKLIEDDKQAIINAFGIDTYNKLADMYWKWMGSGY